MTDIDKIGGTALLRLFKNLQVQKIPLKMQLTNSDVNHLTVISRIRKRKRILHFLINWPGVDRKLDEAADQSCIKFEFNDTENIKYVFESKAWKPSGAMIWVRFPDFVHRYQRRTLYRLEAPPGTRLYFKANDINYKLLVINLSLGGTLGVMVSMTKAMEQELKRYNSRFLKNVKLLFPSKDRKHAGTIVTLKRCEVKRQEKNPVTNKSEYAIEFKEISEAEQENLTDLFYQWQRDYLRRRRFWHA